VGKKMKKIIGIFIIMLLNISTMTTIATNVNKNNYDFIKYIMGKF
jgi:hypothetical protein